MSESPSTNVNVVGVIGAGTMGAGIAQVAAAAGWSVRLKDVDEATVRSAIAGIETRFDRLVEKGRLRESDRGAAAARLHVAAGPDDLADCSLVVEAVVEKMDVKAKVLGELLPAIPDAAIIATNTSSLSVSELGERLGEAQRTVGMHFFNPAPLMKLVEVIAGRGTDSKAVDRTASIAAAWGKKVARAADVPGFIVNHVARPYYLEAFRIIEDGYAAPNAIDRTMKEIGGFRMGPFELTDLIGHDVNTETTRQVWEAVGKPALLHPSAMQQQLVAHGSLGRKSGRGVYDYTKSDAPTPTPALAIDQREIEWSGDLRKAVAALVERAVETPGNEVRNYVFARILVAIIAQAFAAHERGIASKADIDTAMRYGVNYPYGPFEWAERIGLDRVNALLRALDQHVSSDRFATTLIDK